MSRRRIIDVILMRAGTWAPQSSVGRRLPGRVQPVRFQQGVQRRPADAEQPGDRRQRAAAAGQRLLQHLALGAQPRGAQIERRLRLRRPLKLEIGGLDQRGPPP